MENLPSRALINTRAWPPSGGMLYLPVFKASTWLEMFPQNSHLFMKRLLLTGTRAALGCFFS
jgi:hypothetical protein